MLCPPLEVPYGSTLHNTGIYLWFQGLLRHRAPSPVSGIERSVWLRLRYFRSVCGRVAVNSS